MTAIVYDYAVIAFDTCEVIFFKKIEVTDKFAIRHIYI